MNPEQVPGARSGVDEGVSPQKPTSTVGCAPPTSPHNVVVPSLQVGFDLYCTTCACNIIDCNLLKSKTCRNGHPVRLRRQIDGLYFLCPRCDVVISRLMGFCYRCRRRNNDVCLAEAQIVAGEIYQWCETQTASSRNSGAMLWPKNLSKEVKPATGHPVPVITSGHAGVPSFQGGLDLYCPKCGKNAPFMMMDKPAWLPCSHKFPVSFERDWLYRSCIRCYAVLSDEMEYCYRCRSRNEHYVKNARLIYSSKLIEAHRQRKKIEQRDEDVFSEDVFSDAELVALTEQLEQATGQAACSMVGAKPPSPYPEKEDLSSHNNHETVESVDVDGITSEEDNEMDDRESEASASNDGGETDISTHSNGPISCNKSLRNPNDSEMDIDSQYTDDQAYAEVERGNAQMDNVEPEGNVVRDNQGLRPISTRSASARAAACNR